MTREEIEELKGLAASMGLYDDKKPCKRAVILGKAIEALEQEPVLDKIKAKIKGMYRVILKNTPDDNWAVRWNDCLDEVVQIIDKYKAESEG
jgi:hypothetical protein